MSVCAAADPRSDALAGAARCQSIPDDRTFLNCVYGAMQPLRLELGLQPAPPAQTGLVPPATLPMVPVSPPHPAAVSRAAPRDQGMLGGLLGSGKTEVAPQRAASFSFDPHGFFTVALADGTVWKQLDGDTARAHWHGPPSELVVMVRAGALGAHVLQLKGQSTVYKVIRVR
ncbi:MAG: hypothetical protein JO256_11010 [Alphaproteobacteria bacterium]|nr:hypothetical protein [Alphaproteobacteria bacterium]